MWRVVDCPDHECCALEFESGVLCLACGSAIGDTLAGPAPLPPSSELVAEARAAWIENQGVRDFTSAARERYPSRQGEDDDGT